MGAAERRTLNRVLGRMLPGADETLLLRAILHRGETARRAWNGFGARVADLPSLFRTDTGNRKRLSPLLLRSARENGLDIDPALGTVLRTATLREELRADIYRRIAAEAYAALRAREVSFLVLKGAALMETHYAEPALRHAHDVDLLVPAPELDRAAGALRDTGLVEAAPLPWGQGRDLRHATQLPILLLTRLYRMPFYRGDFERTAPRARFLESPSHGPWATLDATDALLLALAHASYCPGRSNLMWAVDAWQLLHGSEGVDWAALPTRAREMRVELPVATQLEYLRTDLGAPVPAGLPGELTAGLEADGLRRDVALFGARQIQGAHPDLDRRSPGRWRERLTLLRWELLPSRAYMEWAYHEPPRVLLPVLYLLRPISALAERAKWALLRRLRRR